MQAPRREEGFGGADGARTRDLRRDRPERASAISCLSPKEQLRIIRGRFSKGPMTIRARRAIEPIRESR